jgi:hypothetical protein
MDEHQLDELLDTWRVAPASITLRDALLASAPQPGSMGLRLPRLAAAGRRGLRLWFAGAGLAAALAGVSCGAVVSSVALREARDEALVTAAVAEGSSAVIAFSEPQRS